MVCAISGAMKPIPNRNGIHLNRCWTAACIVTRLRSQRRDVDAALLEYGLEREIGGAGAVIGYLRIEVVNEMRLHPHRHHMAEPALEHLGVLVAAGASL